MLDPSYAAGFAQSASESANPGFWDGSAGMYVPPLGPTGVTLYDQSLFKNNGTFVTIAAADWKTTENGWALICDSTTDGIDVDGLTSDTTFSIVAWCKRTNNSANRYILDAQTGRFVFAFRLGKLAYYDGTWRAFSATTVPTGEWIQIAATLDATDTTGTGYLNGKQWGTPLTYTPKSIGGNVGLWGHNIQTNNGFLGDAGSVMVYDRVLTSNEIELLYIDPHAPLRLRRKVYPTAVVVAGNAILRRRMEAA